MRKIPKIFSMGFICLLILTMTSCGNKENTDANKFKNDYEEINNKENSAGLIHREVSIDSNNPFVYASGSDIVKLVEDKETFYVYFGSPTCPWCRSVIETAISVANEKKVDKIYYVDIWGDDHEEILRDVYELDSKGVPKLSKEGDASYQQLLQAFANVLSDYTLTDAKGKKVSVGEKRIFAPNFIYVEKGEAKKLVEGISDKQTDARETLTTEMLKDEKEIFTEFFNN